MEPSPLLPLPHSGWGIASLVISLASWLMVLIPLGIWGVIAPSADMPHAAPGDIPPGIIEWVFGKIFMELFGGLLAAFAMAALMIPASTMLVALGLGVAGLFQQGRRKTCALLGTVVSAVGLASVLALALVLM